MGAAVETTASVPVLRVLAATAADSPVAGAANKTTTNTTNTAECPKGDNSTTVFLAHTLPSEVPGVHTQTTESYRMVRKLRRQKDGNYYDSRHRHRYHRGSRESDEYARSTHEFEQGEDMPVRFVRGGSRDDRRSEWERDGGDTQRIRDRHRRSATQNHSDGVKGCSARRRMRRRSRSRSRSYDPNRRPSWAYH